jgi:hypothetical protein
LNSRFKAVDDAAETVNDPFFASTVFLPYMSVVLQNYQKNETDMVFALKPPIFALL